MPARLRNTEQRLLRRPTAPSARWRTSRTHFPTTIVHGKPSRRHERGRGARSASGRPEPPLSPRTLPREARPVLPPHAQRRALPAMPPRRRTSSPTHRGLSSTSRRSRRHVRAGVSRAALTPCARSDSPRDGHRRDHDRRSHRRCPSRVGTGAAKAPNTDRATRRSRGS
jgi:hypothetical protein